MDPDAVVNPLGWIVAAGIVRGDDEHLVSGTAEMLEYPENRVGDAVDIREERFCDDRNAHTDSVAAVPVREVARRDTTHE